MIRAARWAAVLIALQAAGALAQTAGVPDVPAGTGTLRGRIVHASRPEAVAGLPVLLYALPADGTPGLREGRADAQGRFVFADVSNDPGTVYLVGVRVAEVPFGARVRFAGGEREQMVTLEVSDPTADAAGTSVEDVRLELTTGCGSLHVRERHALRNPTSRVIHVPESERAGREPLFRSELPEGASGFEPRTGMFTGSLALEGRQLVFWGPLYPGSQPLEFDWSLPAPRDGLVLARRFAAGAGRLRVRTPAGAPAPRADGLGAGRRLREDGRLWREQDAGRIAQGGGIEIRLELARAPASHALALGEARLWLELDDAALEVDQQLRLTVAGDAPLVSAAGAPLLCLPLPPGVEGLRFSNPTLELGLELDPAGQLALHGPVPPGESIVALRYHLPAAAGSAALALRFPLRVPLLSVFVTDTGVRADTERLHRRRPFRSEDRSYMHLEGFEIDADERVDLALARLAPRQPLPELARAGFALTLAALAIGFLVAPLRAPRAEPALASPQAAAAAAERESVLAALRDLEEDFATGKLDPADHAEMRSELRGRAVALLAAERAAAAPAPAAATPAPAGCPRCAAPTSAGARFCSNCGVALERPSEGGAA